MEMIKINLATFEYQNKRLAYPMLIGAAILLLLLSWYTVQISHRYQNEIFEYEKRVDDLEQMSVKRQKITASKEKELTEQEIKSLQDEIQFVNQRIIEDVFPWSGLLDSLETDIPDGITLSNFSISKDPSKAKLRGEARSMKEIGMFLANLEKSKTFRDSHLINLSINQSKNNQDTTGEESQSIDFEIESFFDMDQILQSSVHPRRSSPGHEGGKNLSRIQLHGVPS
ncbi:MAG: PilN domain-containing protein [Deltaproteobacteria bacterium]|nr:PilN domain-containing protein [Deltaproteobacteria bacterium]